VSTTTGGETRIEASPDNPTITITREFDAPVEAVFRAHTDPELYARWVGPRRLETRIESWDARTGGEWSYRSFEDGQEIAAFFGSFHEVRPNERIVQTFTWRGAPDGVSLEVGTFEDLGDGRTRFTGTSIVESIEIRDMILASGMESGVVEGYEALDELLAGQ
jgi:uncharacterized protein YndB with AHSA1/START domain